MARKLIPGILALLGIGCAGASGSIYYTPDREAEFQNEYSRRLAAWPIPYETVHVGTTLGIAHVIVSGPAAAPPVVLLHAMGMTSLHWRANVGSLAAAHRVYLIDFIGDLGRSRLYDLDEHPADGEEAAAWLVEVLDALSLPKVDVVGASYGGWLALNLAAQRPERVGRVALLGPMGLAPVTLKVVARLTKLLLAPTDANKRELIAWTLGDDPAVRAEFERYLFTAMSCRNEVPIPYELGEARLRRVRAPVLLLLGELDGPLGPPEAAASRARNQLADVEVVVLAGTGHLMNAERAETVDAHLLRFLAPP